MSAVFALAAVAVIECGCSLAAVSVAAEAVLKADAGVLQVVQCAGEAVVQYCGLAAVVVISK